MSTPNDKQLRLFESLLSTVIDKFKESQFLAFSALGLITWLFSLFFEPSKTQSFNLLFYIIIIAPLFMEYRLALEKHASRTMRVLAKISEILAMGLLLYFLVFVADNGTVTNQESAVESSSIVSK
ncbi:hypothetical protein WOB65_22805 [Vibrio parahaemolyticus]|nr:hypothetical protein [Vibrio parahaemolyticus]HCH6158837.1 hypothetical protein [Vibrio parahaemolyticus]